MFLARYGPNLSEFAFIPQHTKSTDKKRKLDNLEGSTCESHANKLIENLGNSAAVHRRCSFDTNLSRLPRAKKLTRASAIPTYQLVTSSDL